MQIVDANIILRYLLNDHIELSEQARRIIEENDVMVPVEVLCEVVFVLMSVYKVSRDDTCSELYVFFTNTRCELPHRDSVLKGIEIFSTKNLDFVDCILAGYNEVENATVHTFDNQLLKLLKPNKS